MTFRQIIKRFFEPVKYVPKSYSFFIIAEAFDVFQSIFVIQLGFYITSAVEKWNTDDIWFRWYVLLWFLIFWRIFAVAIEVIYEYVDEQLEFTIKKNVLNKFLILDNNKCESLGTGKVQNIINAWVSSWNSLLRWSLTSIIFEIIGIMYAFVLMIYQVPTMYHFFWLVSLFLISSFFMWKWLQILEEVRKKSKELYMEQNRHDVKFIMSKMEILQNNKLDYELEKQREIVDKRIWMWQKWNFKKWLWQMCASALVDGLQWRILVGIWFGVLTWQYTLAYLMLMLQLVRTIERYIWQLRRNFQWYLDNKTHLEKLRDLLDNNKPVQKYTEWNNFQYSKWDINIDHIKIKYNDNNIFDDFSLELKWWTKTAFVWESGWGKTTLIKLLAWYLRPDSGEIVIDGQKLSEVKLTDYYLHIGYLTQDPSVFDGTIWENLTYALDGVGTDSWSVHDDDIETDAWSKPTQSFLDSEVKRIIKLAKCEFIYDFEHGLQTEIGERGVRLSGWQKQRLAIAKIMLKNPNIILLDEPTSALDSFNEELVSQALNNLFKWKTVIVVAHRLQTVKNADRILYIEWWKVIEDGTHTSLIKQNWRYKKMLDLQSWF